MTATNGGSSVQTALAELAVELRYIRAQLDSLTARFDAAEKDREARSSTYQAQVGDLRQTAAMNIRRLDQLEKQHAEVEAEVRQTTRSVERLSTTVGILAAASGTVASAGALWIIAQVLGLIK
jgi:chromosome segregation ATPase